VELAPGGVTATPEEWWCCNEADRLLVLTGAHVRTRLRDTLRHEAGRVGGTVYDASEALTCVAVVGRRMPHLLAAIGLVPPTLDLRIADPLLSS
jgi:hypothetical protein